MTEYICENADVFFDTETMPSGDKVVQRMTIDIRVKQEIVRCRDCVHYKPYRTYQHGIMNRCHDEQGHTHRRYESDFCSRGERRSE